jgi:hypothetical protein
MRATGLERGRQHSRCVPQGWKRGSSTVDACHRAGLEEGAAAQ